MGVMVQNKVARFLWPTVYYCHSCEHCCSDSMFCARNMLL